MEPRNPLKDFFLDFIALLKDLKINVDKEKLSLEKLVDCYSTKTDKIILEQEQKNKFKYIAGEFKVYYKDEKTFGITVSLYFKDIDEEWQKVSIKSPPEDHSLKMKHLTPEAIDRLRKERTVVFEIDYPEKTV